MCGDKLYKDLLESAHEGNPLAQYKLGLMYYKGNGVAQDYIEACKWFTLAAAQGVQDASKAAAKLGDLLLKRSCFRSIAEAQRLAKEFKPKSPKNTKQKLVVRWWTWLFSDKNPTGMKFIGQILVVLLVAFFAMLVGALAGGIIHGGLKAKLVYIGDVARGVGIISVIGVLILGIRKLWRKRQRK